MAQRDPFQLAAFGVMFGFGLALVTLAYALGQSVGWW